MYDENYSKIKITKRHKMVLKYERFLTSLKGEMQIKAAMRYYFSPIRLAKTQKLDNILLVKLWENSLTFLVESKLPQLLRKGIWRSNKTTHAYAYCFWKLL